MKPYFLGIWKQDFIFKTLHLKIFGFFYGKLLGKKIGVPQE